MTVVPKLQAAKQLFELKPLVDEDLSDLPQTRTLRLIGAEALRYMSQPQLAAEEFDIPPDAPTLFLVGPTSDGSYFVTVKV